MVRAWRDLPCFHLLIAGRTREDVEFPFFFFGVPAATMAYDPGTESDPDRYTARIQGSGSNITYCKVLAKRKILPLHT